MGVQTDYATPDAREHVPFERISWPSVFAGVIVAVVLQLAFALLGLGIGASTVDPLQESSPMAGLGLGAGIWLAGSTLLSLFAGGWISGKLAGPSRHRDGAVHGLVVWGLSTLLAFLLIGSVMGAFFGRATGFLGNLAVDRSGEFSRGWGQLSPDVRDGLRSGNLPALTPEQEARAREAADTAARRTSQTALWGFAALVLGALAASVGGMAGAPRTRVAGVDFRSTKNPRDEYTPRTT
ncbi:MAG: hypothetical protein IOD12_07445 [Silvanigrellales bacterium]|nr:hypothetical protein [Silvanigrellales bacterium]